MPDLLSSLKELQKITRPAEKLISAGQRALKAQKEVKAPAVESDAATLESLALQIISESLFELQAILMSELRTAISRVREYSYPAYSSRLFEAFDNPSLIKVMYIANSFIVNIEAREYLGDTQEWLDIAAGARETAKTGNRTLTQRAAGWRFIYKIGREGWTPSGRMYKKGVGWTYNTRDHGRDFSSYRGKYNTILEERMSRVRPGTAPFWELLNYGHASRLAYPSNPPTNFIQTAEVRMQTHLKDELSRRYLEYQGIRAEEGPDFEQANLYLGQLDLSNPNQAVTIFEDATRKVEIYTDQLLKVRKRTIRKTPRTSFKSGLLTP